MEFQTSLPWQSNYFSSVCAKISASIGPTDYSIASINTSLCTNGSTKSIMSSLTLSPSQSLMHTPLSGSFVIITLCSQESSFWAISRKFISSPFLFGCNTELPNLWRVTQDLTSPCQFQS